MEVLKKGSAHLPWSKKVKCSKCDSTLKLSKEDIKEETVVEYDRGEPYNEKYTYFVCPVCKKKNKTIIKR